MSSRPARNPVRMLLFAYLLLLVPISWLATRYQPYQMDGDSMAYMDIADLIRSQQWAGVVNGYWHPLYPAALALAHALFHPTRWTEIPADYAINLVIFLLSVAAMLAFVHALVKLRARMLPSEDQLQSSGSPLLGTSSLMLLGTCLLVIAAQRELSTNLIKPDALLQALMLAAFAAMLESLATGSVAMSTFAWPPLMGLFFGLAYLTKSFAFLVALLSVAVMMLFARFILRRSIARVVAQGALAFVVFAAVAGPYVAALSHQKHRFDFGDSGALNYAWYVSGTDKMHLQPSMTGDFGSATVQLLHPDRQLLAHPGIYSYKAEPYGTYPDWFDPTYFNERITPKFDAARLVHRDLRNLALVVRYLFNHPEAWVLLILLLVFGARFHTGRWPHAFFGESFWMPTVALGLAMWCIYGLVNIEERYVTLAYLLVVLPIFAMLRVPHAASADREVDATGIHRGWLRSTATAMVALLAFLALGETLRTALDDRRNTSGTLPAPWYSPAIFGAAHGLLALGVHPGDEIACIGTTACLHDPYWQRLAGVRVLTEVYNPADQHLIEQLQSLPNRQQVYDILKSQGAKVLVGYFDPGTMNGTEPAAEGWQRLGDTGYYALPLSLPAPPLAQPVPKPWTPKMEVAP
jgi:hypothetical protein